MAHPTLTKGFLQLSPEAASFGSCDHLCGISVKLYASRCQSMSIVSSQNMQGLISAHAHALTVPSHMHGTKCSKYEGNVSLSSLSPHKNFSFQQHTVKNGVGGPFQRKKSRRLAWLRDYLTIKRWQKVDKWLTCMQAVKWLCPSTWLHPTTVPTRHSPRTQ